MKPGEFDVFSVSAGPLPTDVNSISLPALQTYSDGSVVRWIEPQVAGGPEPNALGRLQIVAAGIHREDHRACLAFLHVAAQVDAYQELRIRLCVGD